MGISRNIMLFLFLSIITVGIVGLGAWLWRHRQRRVAAGKEESRETAKLSNDGVPVGIGSDSRTAKESETKEVPQSLEPERIVSDKAENSANSQAKEGACIKNESASSCTSIDNEAGGTLIEPPADCPSDRNIECEEAREDVSNKRKEHLQSDSELPSATIATERGEAPAPRQTNTQAEDSTTSDETSSGDIVCADLSPEARPEEGALDGVWGSQFEEDGGLADEHNAGGSETEFRPNVAELRASTSQEDGLKTETDEGHQEDYRPDGVEILGEAYGIEKGTPRPVRLVEGMENADSIPPSEEQQREKLAEAVEDEEDGKVDVQAEAGVLKSRGLLNPDECPRVDERLEPQTEEPVRGEVSTPTGNGAPTKAKEKKQPAVYRDRRGSRRRARKATRNSTAGQSSPAEARLRLMLDSVQRKASLSVILMRPEGFPERIQPLLDGESPVEAFDAGRYDDLVLEWTGELLGGELRIGSKENHQWLRAARALHIFSDSPAESGMISVGCARPDAMHAVICRTDDEEAVRAASELTGSAPLVTHENWNGIPDGWMVLSGYCPRHAAEEELPTRFSPLDPGTEVEISLAGGLAIRATVYAEGSPPRIGIDRLAAGASVTIGGISAKQAADGAWEADGWDTPGHHLIDVVPGPSLTYQIMADPVMNEAWQFWDAHPERFGAHSDKPWARAGICGAAVRGAEGETVVAASRLPILIALGERREAAALAPRGDVNASVALMSEAPCFLVSATGLRRKQGRIIWLGSRARGGGRSSPDDSWVETVRRVAARGLRLEGADLDGERVWRNVKRRARRIWRTR